MTLHIATPLVASTPLTQCAGQPVWLKMEALQPCGSFKLRGIGHACEVYAQQGATRFVSSSVGNAGLAVAYAGRQLGIAVTVVVPETTSTHAIELLEQNHATVIVTGRSWWEAHRYAQSLMEPHDAFLHPFDDPLIWHGHASLIAEVAAARLRPGAVVLSVGGGGLMSGVIEGLVAQGWDDIPVIAVETHGAASLDAAIRQGKPTDIGQVDTVATSLGARQVCDQAFHCTQTHPVISVQVSDAAAIAGCRRFLDDHRILVEPACGAALACVYEAHPALANLDNILVVVCGGATMTVDKLLNL